jgi:hypothetical protein
VNNAGLNYNLHCLVLRSGYFLVEDVEDAHPQHENYHPQHEDAAVQGNICRMPVSFPKTRVIHMAMNLFTTFKDLVWEGRFAALGGPQDKSVRLTMFGN